MPFSFWYGTWMPFNNLGYLFWNFDMLLNLTLWRVESFGQVVLICNAWMKELFAFVIILICITWFMVEF